MADFTDEERHQYKRVYDEYIFPQILNNYWKCCFERRENELDEEGNSLWTEQALFTDTIKFAIPKMAEGDEPSPGNQFFAEKSPKNGFIQFYTVVPNQYLFWDCIFSYFILSRPDVYESPQKVIKSFYSILEKTNCDPKKLQNFSLDILKWMDEVYEGKKQFHCLNPETFIRAVFTMKWIVYSSHKYDMQQLSSSEFMETPRVQKELEDIKREIEVVYENVFLKKE